MDILGAIGNGLRILGAALGFVVLLDISFAPFRFTPLEDGRILAETELRGAVTEEVETLIRGSAEIGITYTIVLHRTDGTREETSVSKSIQFRSIDDTYIVQDGATLKTETELSDAVKSMTSVSAFMDLNTDSGIIITASLEVAGIRDKSMVNSLWENRTPRIAHFFARKK